MGGAGSGIAYDEDDLRRIAGAGLHASPDHRGAPRGVDPRLEGVRAGADARPARQRRRRLLDREPRPDGRAHRRLDHRRPGDDADRPRVPADARRRHRRSSARSASTPAAATSSSRSTRPTGRIIVIEMNPRVSRSSRAGVQGDRLPDRQDRRQARHRLHPRRDPQRHHREDAGQLRADARLRRREGAAVRLREVPRGRPDAHHQMKSVGEAMAIGRNFTEALQKALRSLEKQGSQFGFAGRASAHKDALLDAAARAARRAARDGAAGAARGRHRRGGVRGHRRSTRGSSTSSC